MRLAVVSDIHGNFTALETVVADLERRGPTSFSMWRAPQANAGDSELRSTYGRCGTRIVV